MQTVQLPFFLNSGQGRNRSSTGHAFDVELSPPIAVPKNARNTRLFVQEASAVYSFPNVTATTNRVYIYYRSNLFTLQVTPGLYATIDEMQAGIADAAIAAGMNMVPSRSGYGCAHRAHCPPSQLLHQGRARPLPRA